MKQISECGRSMIEVIGVLAIIGVISVALAKTIMSVYDKYKISRVTQQITELKKNISNRYVANGDYSIIDISEMLTENIVPADMKNSGTVEHSFGGAVTIFGDTDTYSVTFPRLTQQACVELALMNWVFSGDSDLFRLKINDTEFNWPIVNSAGAQLPVTASDAMTACSDNATITWTFR